MDYIIKDGWIVNGKKEKPLIHGMTLSMTYLIIQFIFHLKDINIQILIKPLFVFIIYYLLYYIKKKQQ